MLKVSVAFSRLDGLPLYGLLTFPGTRYYAVYQSVVFFFFFCRELMDSDLSMYISLWYPTIHVLEL